MHRSAKNGKLVIEQLKQAREVFVSCGDLSQATVKENGCLLA
jgi:ABC-type tungstate transport system permease subunit